MRMLSLFALPLLFAFSPACSAADGSSDQGGSGGSTGTTGNGSSATTGAGNGSSATTGSATTGSGTTAATGSTTAASTGSTTAGSGGAGTTGSSSAAAGGSGGSSGACTGKPGAPGLSPRQISVGGVQRTYLLYIPPALSPSQAARVVFAHHGFTMSGEIMRTLTQYQTLADQDGFVVAFPDGIGTTWNAGMGVCGVGGFSSGTSDDFGFVAAMLDDIEADQCIDRAHVFVTGFSMGGYFSNHIGCKRPDLVTAIAPHSGGGPPAGCVTGPMPAMIIHGTADALIVYSCGVAARDYWAMHNGCSTAVSNVPVLGGTCEYNQNCPPGGQVVLCHMDGMAHGWAGHTGQYGGGTNYEDATRLTWDFFKSQP